MDHFGLNKPLAYRFFGVYPQGTGTERSDSRGRDCFDRNPTGLALKKRGQAV